MTSTSSRVSSSDVAEMLVGGIAMAFPVAMTEEAWNLGEELSWFRITVLLVGSICILGWYGIHIFHGGKLRENWRHFVIRLAVVYLLTAILCTLLLVLLDRWPILDDPGVALRRTILVAFPAVFAATIVDSLR